MEAPTGRGSLEGLWKSIALLLLSFLLCAAFIGTPAGAKLTGEYALRLDLERERAERIRLQRQHDDFVRETGRKLEVLPGMQKDVEWLVKWLQAAGRK